MHKRAAILIASPSANTNKATSDKYLRGSFYDIDNWSTFLQRPIGGCWNRNEIHDLSKYTVQGLFDEISQLKETDYVFFAYSGHGYNDGCDDFIFMENGTKTVKVNDIIMAIQDANSKIKGTLIFDSCRNNPLNESFVSIPAPSLPLNENFFDELVDTARKDWDNQFEHCSSNGLVIIQSCQKNEKSYMRQSGEVSVFSYHMANNGFEAQESLDVGHAFEDAFDQTYAEVKSWQNHLKKQQPKCTYTDEKCTADYPFSLGKKSTGLNLAAALVSPNL